MEGEGRVGGKGRGGEGRWEDGGDGRGGEGGGEGRGGERWEGRGGEGRDGRGREGRGGDGRGGEVMGEEMGGKDYGRGRKGTQEGERKLVLRLILSLSLSQQLLGVSESHGSSENILEGLLYVYSSLHHSFYQFILYLSLSLLRKV